MTILVGVLCQDGVVVGTDSSATFIAGGFRTVEQKTDKIYIIGGKIIIATTGSVGLGQRFKFVVENYYLQHNNSFDGIKYQEVAVELCRETKLNFNKTMVGAERFGGLLSFHHDKKAYLCEFAEQDFQPEFKTSSLWYVSMGSGQAIADPFLGFIRRIFWRDLQPSCKEGIFYVLWVLEHTIDLNPGGIKGPVQIATLQLGEDNITPIAYLLDNNDLKEHGENIKGVEEHLAKYKEMLQGKGVEEIPKIPS